MHSHSMGMHVVGIMSGTSLDGVDFVLTQIERETPQPKVQFLEMESVRFPKPLQGRLFQAANHQLKVDQLAELHFELGRFYAKSLALIQKKKNWKIELIGLHGQTVYHRGPHATLQIGEPSFLSAAFNCPVVSQFRNADVAMGGQGAPLAPLFHQVAYSGVSKNLAVQNLGGIGNVSWIVNEKLKLAFDTGPANMALDWIVQNRSRGRKSFDPNGNGARKGQIVEEIVEKALRHPYFKKSAPKSCGREEFGEKWVRSLWKKSRSTEDLLATFTEITARSIAGAYQKEKISAEKIVLCGGGSKNQFLKERIQAQFQNVQVMTSEQAGWPSQAIEGAAFAYLAALRFWNLKSEVQASTGGSAALCLGQITQI